MKLAWLTSTRTYKHLLLIVLTCSLAACQQSTETTLAQAFLHLEAGELDTADTLFRDVILEDASNAQATYGRSRVMTEKGKWADAYALSVRATALEPGNGLYQRAAFDLEIAARNWKLALARIESVTFVNEEEAVTSKARALLGLSSPEKAYDLLMLHITKYPMLTAQAALAAHAAGNSSQATKLFTDAKDLGIATRELSIAHLVLSNDDTALLDWVDANPDDSDLILVAAEMKIRNGEFEFAKSILEQSDQHRFKRIDHAITYIELMGLLGTQSDIFLAYLDELPNNSALWQAANAYGNGVIFLQLGEIEKARPLLEDAVTVLPNRSRLHLTLGLIYYSDDKFDIAKSNLEKGLRQIPTAGTAQLALADILIRDNNLGQATRRANVAMKTLPDSAKPLELLALIQAKQGNSEQALKLLAMAEKHQPLSTTAKVLVAQLNQTLGRHELALQSFKAMDQTEEPDIAILTGIVDSLVALDRAKEAISFLEEKPNPITNRLAAILWIRIGNLNEAKKRLPSQPIALADQLVATNIFALEENIPALKQLASLAVDDHVSLVIATELARLGEFEQALSIFQSLNATRPNEPNVLNGIAHCIYALDLRDQIALAQAYAQRAHLAFPNNPTFKATLKNINTLLQIDINDRRSINGENT